ncbi:MAG: hypothetical protein AB4080_19340 [Trichodesmium sp.]
MSTTIIYINIEQQETEKVKTKNKKLKKRAKIKPPREAQETSLDEYLQKSDHESLEELLVRFVYGFIIPI